MLKNLPVSKVVRIMKSENTHDAIRSLKPNFISSEKNGVKSAQKHIHIMHSKFVTIFFG